MKYLLDGRETERLLFRKIKQSDFNTWLDFFKDPESSIHWVSENQTPENECENWYKKQFHRYENGLGGMNALIEKETGRLIGHCGLLVQIVDNITELEIGYSLLTEFRNKGYATEAAKKCRDFAFENNFSESLISIISLTNTPSQKVALKNGMKIDKQTIYNNNEVYIFRIQKQQFKS